MIGEYNHKDSTISITLSKEEAEELITSAARINKKGNTKSNSIEFITINELIFKLYETIMDNK